ncbi:MAG TPA: hypothetical protein VJV78_25890 [Polyangiales bacterium]|nr:hypothetical protein [Polyangiales bacterium]
MLDLPRSSYGTHARFAFGGVAFTVLAAREVRWQLPAECERLVSDVAAVPAIAQVICEVELDAALPDGPPRIISTEQGAASTHVSSEEFRVELIPIGPGRYRARARIAKTAAGALVLGLAAAINERQGGLSLHAAAIELDDRAVLFIGPSGAGKSTAVLLARGAAVFAYDRVAVSCQDGRYRAWSLPGGMQVAASHSARRELPLGAIYRIRQAHDRPQIKPLTAASALFALRESTQVTDTSELAEQRRLDVAQALLARVPVAELHTVLGSSHVALLQQRGEQHALV